MQTVNLDKTVAKLLKGHSFKGVIKTRIEKQFDDSDWIFLAKTIRNRFKDGTVTYDPEGLKDLFITLLILSKVSEVNDTYRYDKYKNVTKGLQVLPALWSSFQASDVQFLYRRALESISLALALASGNILEDTGWGSNLETAALCVLAILEDIAAVAAKTAKAAKVPNDEVLGKGLSRDDKLNALLKEGTAKGPEYRKYKNP